MATKSNVVKVFASFTDANGVVKPLELAIPAAVSAFISEGMSFAHKTETSWKDHAVEIVTAFYDWQPAKGTLEADDIIKELRSEERRESVVLMYQAFQERHPQWSKAQKAKAEAEAGNEDSKPTYEGYIRSIRAVANNQVQKVIRYFAAVFMKEAPKGNGSRDLPNARQLIETFRRELMQRVELKRGPFANKAEQVLANKAIDALTDVLAEDTRAKAAAHTTSLLTAPATQESKQSKKSYAGTKMTADEYAQAQAAEAAEAAE